MFKEVFFDMQDELEQTKNEAQAQEKLNSIKNLVEHVSIQPIGLSTDFDKKEEESLLVKKSLGKSKTQGSPAVPVYKIPSISGCLFGATLGGIIGKSITLSTLGALSGGAIAYTAVYFLQKNSSPNDKGRVILEKLNKKNLRLSRSLKVVKFK